MWVDSINLCVGGSGVVSIGTETIGDTVRETVKEARKAARESSKAAAEAAEEIQSDLEALREDIAQLAERLDLIVTAQGGRAWNRTKANVDDAIADAESRVRRRPRRGYRGCRHCT